MPVSVLVMAKAPRAGRVKTRLVPLLGAEGCARLQAALIGVVCRWAADVAPHGAYLAYGPADAQESELRAHVPDSMRLFADGDGDLGDRLAAATDRVLRARAEPLLVVGTDMPTLTRAHAREAEAVLRAGADAVFGPALDGGYWIVGLARPMPDAFDLGAAWGGPTVLERSLERVHEAGLRAELLGSERDLDHPADARALASHPGMPREVAEILRPAVAA
jgi:uncharacterized protein